MPRWRRWQCGCVCLRCCYWPEGTNPVEGQNPPCFEGTKENPPEQCTPALRGDSLLDECELFDEDTCGIEYSTFEQAVWCAIEHPMAVPTYMQVCPMLAFGFLEALAVTGSASDSHTSIFMPS